MWQCSWSRRSRLIKRSVHSLVNSCFGEPYLPLPHKTHCVQSMQQERHVCAWAGHSLQMLV